MYKATIKLTDSVYREYTINVNTLYTSVAEITDNIILEYRFDGIDVTTNVKSFGVKVNDIEQVCINTFTSKQLIISVQNVEYISVNTYNIIFNVIYYGKVQLVTKNIIVSN